MATRWCQAGVKQDPRADSCLKAFVRLMAARAEASATATVDDEGGE